MKHTLKYLKPYMGFFFVILLAKLTAAVLELMIPSALGDILDIAAPSGSVSLIVRYGLKMAIFALCTATLNMSSNITSSHFIHKAVERLRQDLFQKVSTLSSAQLDDVTEASAVTRLTSDTYNITQMLIGCMTMGIRTPILMVGGIIVALQEDVMLTLVLFLAVPMVTLVAIHGNRIAVPKFRARQAASDHMVRTVQENVTGIRVIKALSKTEHEKKRFDAVNADLAEKTMDASLVSSKKSNTNILILNLMQALMILVGALRVNAGLMTAGKIVAFMSYFTMITNAALNIANILMMVSNGTASAQRMAEIFEKPQDLQVQDIPQDENPCALEFRNVRFSYLGQADNLENLSFRLEKGQTLGIIGATGSGKTTLVNLLLRFYDVDEGAIFIHGQDIRSIEDGALREKFGVAMQSDFLVADTTQNNIDFYRHLPKENLLEAAKIAQAEEFIREKEGGMDYPLAIKGANLSGGQKQRLLIARAVASKPEILILDDSSSALDYRTDASLRRALSENLHDTTKIIVAQRVSSIANADLILVLEDGKVIGQGKHQDLLHSCEEYAHIARIQMEAVGEEVAHCG
ncbi:MAG: ABC transporter ATP-binding protein [Oscillospiraceae bacterium]|nr:ABC transporter ATP-binding protein [Oscillospiraceae bacterium]